MSNKGRAGVRDDGPTEPVEARRIFLKGAVALVLGGGALLTAPAAGLKVFLEPLRRAGGAGQWVRVGRLGALPEDGTPRRFPIVADQVNAWTRSPDVPIGAVFLRRTGPAQVVAFNVVCPHAGCLVDFAAGSGQFLCPCHNSTFALDGRVDDPSSPSPRGLDQLETELRNNDEVWVRFQNYRSGPAEKIPV
jgi:menaquinol-cytochrome c reductase iron-sulfur subunit